MRVDAAGRVPAAGHQTALRLGILLACLSASGMSCPRVLNQYTQPIPRALPPAPTLVQIQDVVNDNTGKIQSLWAPRATVSTPGMPSVTADISYQRPRSFRLLGRAPIIGPEVDVGSNDELFWFWMKHGQPPGMFYCRHDQYHASSARQLLPLEPDWLVEAIGVVALDPTGVEGPFAVGSGRAELRVRASAATRGMSKIIVIDDSRGVILEEHVYDASGARVATAIMSKHQRDMAAGVTLPRHIEIQCPSAHLELSIDMPNLQVNQLPADPRELFARPSYPGFNEIDLAQPGVLAPTQGAPGQVRLPPAARY